ncbi:gamma-glutamyltranspeptidase [Morchella snyderi]|nr:gamma-glutamyltranspeptidase [Morchella snyderi]
MSRSASPTRVRFSPEISRSHSPDWDPSPDSDDPQQQMLAKPLPLQPTMRGRRRRADDDRGEVVWMRLPVTITLVAVLIFFAVGFGIIFWENEADGSDSDILVNAQHGAVSSDVEICSEIGVGILKKGGNSVDAIIATAICIGVVDSFASGIGGGGFLVTRTIYGESKSFNFREMAPGTATRDMYNGQPLLAQVGGLAVATPGEVDGFATAHALHGKLAWHELWAPSIELCRGGFVVTPMLGRLMQAEAAFFTANKRSWEYLFSEKTGKLLSAGDVMRREAYGNTLEVIAAADEAREGGDTYKGVREFYNGTIAKQLARFVQDNGGILTEEDFEKYFTVVEETAKTVIDDMQFITCQSPCSGPVLIEGLNIAEGLDMRDSQDPLSHHYLVETMKWLSAGRTELGDPSDPTVAANHARIHELTTKHWAASVRANISSTHTYPWAHYKPAYELTDPKGTSHISAFDRRGGAAALTTTVNLYWGAKLHDPVTGIVLNSEMDDFSIPGRGNAYNLEPSVYNYIRPYKRPLSSTAPTIVVEGDGSVGLVVGASGGSRIVTGVFEAVVKTYFWGWDLLDTIKSPRLHHQLIPETVSAEWNTEAWVVRGLEKRGHKVVMMAGGESGGGSAIQAVRGREGRVEGVADWWRKGGRAAGY